MNEIKMYIKSKNRASLTAAGTPSTFQTMVYFLELAALLIMAWAATPGCLETHD